MSSLQLSQQKKRKVWTRDKNKCTYCKKQMYPDSEEMTVDHILSRQLGGTNDLSNLTTACRKCNQKKAQQERVIIYNYKQTKWR